jgi:flagellar basal-body rod protein FlgB
MCSAGHRPGFRLPVTGERFRRGPDFTLRGLEQVPRKIVSLGLGQVMKTETSMNPIQLFELASRQAEWLTVRQSVVSGNIANANTPGFRAKDVTAFDSVLENTNLPMAATSPLHFTDSPAETYVVESGVDKGAAEQLSGNSVDLSDELMKQGMIKRDYDLNTGLVKAFNQMMLMTVRKG